MNKRNKIETVIPVEKGMEITEEYIGLHAVNPFIANNSSARSYMFSNHISQIVTLEHGEEKIIQTGLEKQFGDTTFSKKLENDSRILNILTRYNGIDINHASETTELTVVYEDIITGEVGIIDIPKYFKLHQYFGFKYKWNYDILNAVTANTILPANTVLADSPTVTTNKGYKFGVNANLAYLSIPEVTEDGVVISKTMAKKLAYKTYETRVVEFGEDSFPLNIYGDEDNYKAFPEIGEAICDDGVLMVLREYNSELTPALTSVNDVRDFDPAFDRCEYVKPKNSKIVDIKVWHNPKHKKSVYTGTTDGVDKYANGLKKYYQELINTYDKLVNDHYRKFKNRDLKISENFHRKLIDAYTIMNSKENKVKFTHRNDNLDIYRMEFVIEHSINEIVLGSKLTSIHG